MIQNQATIVAHMVDLANNVEKDNEKEYLNLFRENNSILLSLYKLLQYKEDYEIEKTTIKNKESLETQSYLLTKRDYIIELNNYYKSTLLINFQKIDTITVSKDIDDKIIGIEAFAASMKLQSTKNLLSKLKAKNKIYPSILKSISNKEYSLYIAEYKYEFSLNPTSEKTLALELSIRTFYPEYSGYTTLPTEAELNQKYSILFQGYQVEMREKYYSKSSLILTDQLIKAMIREAETEDIKEIKEIGADSGSLVFWLEKYLVNKNSNIKVVGIDSMDYIVAIPGSVKALQKEHNVNNVVNESYNKTLYIFSILDGQSNYAYEVLKQIKTGDILMNINEHIFMVNRGILLDYALTYSAKKRAERIILPYNAPNSVYEVLVYEKENEIDKSNENIIKDAALLRLPYNTNILLYSAVLDSKYKMIKEKALKYNEKEVYKYIVENYKKRLNPMPSDGDDFYNFSQSTKDYISENVVPSKQRILISLLQEALNLSKNGSRKQLYTLEDFYVYLEEIKVDGYLFYKPTKK